MGATIGLISTGLNNTQLKASEILAREMNLSTLTHAEGKVIHTYAPTEGMTDKAVFILIPIHIKGPDIDIYLAGKAYQMGHTQQSCTLRIVQR